MFEEKQPADISSDRLKKESENGIVRGDHIVRYGIAVR